MKYPNAALDGENVCEGGNIIAECTTHCDEPDCQSCCPHDEFDHDVCMDCGYERDPGEAIDSAMDMYEDR